MHQHRAPWIPPHLHRAVGSQQHRQRWVEDERHEGDCDTDPRVMRSAIHRPRGRPGRATLGGIDCDSANAEFEKSDPPEAPADHPVDETGWLVEVGGAKLVYDMPTDAVPAILELHDSMFSGGAQVQLAP